MASNMITEDLRIKKTKKALYAAMFLLLKKFSFKKITIKDICEEALISRATFYTHFIDKYDLLANWIAEVWSKTFDITGNYKQIEKTVNRQLDENMLVLKNLINEADDETNSILFNFILSSLNLADEKNSNGEICSKSIVFSNFYAGGIISYLSWQVKNKFPADVPLINRDLYEIMRELQDWQSRQLK